MPDFLTSLVFGAIALVVVLWIKGKWQDEALNAELIAIHRRARIELPEEDLERLTASLLEIREAGFRAARGGLSGKQATRMAKRAAIQQIAAFMEIQRMFTNGGSST